jgi:hypothetical protein
MYSMTRRIGCITGLESLAELKVLNLAGNLIREEQQLSFYAKNLRIQLIINNIKSMLSTRRY